MKVGIITHYYKNANYGGCLQAYALQRYLTKEGYDAEQICYDILSVDKLTWASFSAYSLNKKCRTLARKSIEKILKVYFRLSARKAARFIQEREKVVFSFGLEKTVHSKRVYNIQSIHEAGELYDAFIAGSDQVWNIGWLNPPFFLNFVPDKKACISYAASLGKNKLTGEQLQLFQRYLERFSSISVREEDAVYLLDSVAPVPVKWVLDPTMLLTRQEWEDVCAERQIDVPYVFCYFLGDDSNERKLAQEFACQKHLKLVTIPYLVLNNRIADKEFGDIQLSNISPEQLLSLIKYADYVFTDSFHATVFSGLFKKQYFVFSRSGFASMGSRIDSLTKIYETEERFCNSPERASIEYISALDDINYTRELPMFEIMKKQSKEFLATSLELAKERLLNK